MNLVMNKFNNFHIFLVLMLYTPLLTAIPSSGTCIIILLAAMIIRYKLGTPYYKSTAANNDND